MQPIDLVKHQTRILPGLEEAAHAVIGRLNESRKILNLPVLILQEESTHYVISLEADTAMKQSVKAYEEKFFKRKKAADEVRGRISRREESSREKKKLKEFRAKLKNGTLIEGPDPAIEDWREGSILKPPVPAKRKRA